jgi:predicted glycogen debranching enzyme
MDAKVGDWVVTPRTGKPIEISALWYNALNCAADIGSKLGDNISEFLELAELTRTGFRRFWNEDAGYCYDVIDGPDGNDDALRPNQLLAVSLFHSSLDHKQQKAIVDICANKLLTSYGLRSLGAEEPGYVGSYGGISRAPGSTYS